MVNRRMYRPSFADVKEQAPPRALHNGPSHNNNGPVPSKKPAPPELRTRRTSIGSSRCRGVP